MTSPKELTGDLKIIEPLLGEGDANACPHVPVRDFKDPFVVHVDGRNYGNPRDLSKRLSFSKKHYSATQKSHVEQYLTIEDLTYGGCTSQSYEITMHFDIFTRCKTFLGHRNAIF